MQLSELFRRGIVAATTIEKHEELLSGAVQPGDGIEVIKVDDSDFLILWCSGIIEECNKKCNSLVDDYKEEMIIGDELDKLIDVLKRYIKKGLDVLLEGLLYSILQLALRAKENKTGVIFIF